VSTFSDRAHSLCGIFLRSVGIELLVQSVFLSLTSNFALFVVDFHQSRSCWLCEIYNSKHCWLQIN